MRLSDDERAVLLSVPLMNEGVAGVFNAVTIPGWIEEGVVEVREGGRKIRITERGKELLEEIHRLNS